MIEYFLVLGLVLQPGNNPFLGSWRLNTKQSSYSPGPGPVHERVIEERDGYKIRRVALGTEGDGTPIMQGGAEGISLPWNGKDHLVRKAITMSVTRVDDRTTDTVVKHDGKIVYKTHSVVSKDGKHLTEITQGVDSGGRKFSSYEVFDREAE